MKRVALICVTRNNYPKLEVTLKSILDNTPPNLYDLYIIDNASDDSTIGLYGIALPENITIVRNNKNLNWVNGINQGLDLTKKYEYIGFLNNDIEVCENWLSSLVTILDSNEMIGAVGPLTSNERDWQGYDRVRENFYDLKLPDLSCIDRNDVSLMYKNIEKKKHILINGMLAFFCTILRRKVIDEIGYLDEAFNDIYLGDDDDFCSRLQRAGYYLALSLDAYVAHYSGTSSLGLPEYEARVQKAREILANKRKLHI